MSSREYTAGEFAKAKGWPSPGDIVNLTIINEGIVAARFHTLLQWGIHVTFPDENVAVIVPWHVIRGIALESDFEPIEEVPSE